MNNVDSISSVPTNGTPNLTLDGDRVTIIPGSVVTTIVAVTTVHDPDTDQDVKQVTTVHLTHKD